MDIENDLTELENDLKTKVARDQKTGEFLAYDVDRFKVWYHNQTYNLRECKDVAKIVELLLENAVPQAIKLEDDIYGYFETYGLWDDNTRAIDEKAKVILSQRGIVDDVVNRIIVNCDCRKNKPSFAQTKVNNPLSDWEVVNGKWMKVR